MLIQQPVGSIQTPLTVVLNALSVSTSFFTANGTYQVMSVSAVWGVAGGAAATLVVEKLTSTTAPGSGTTLLSGTLDLTAAANTVVAGTLTATAADLLLASGDRLSCKLGGVLTGLVGCAVTVVVRKL